jgi:aspartate kinase
VNYELSLPALRESLTFKLGQQRKVLVVTGFLGKGLQTGAITTLGRGGSDLTCTLLGAALNLPEVQVGRHTRTRTTLPACLPRPGTELAGWLSRSGSGVEWERGSCAW